ncbi:permease [Streptomyces sp. NPDC127039]|uniref:permease n=1 Tax=Streptomyces sp. NPDC127039 TaxID=3347115 RepID=UPI00364777D8
MSKRAGRQMMRIGLAAGRSTPGERTRWWALFAAAAALAVVATATAAVVATYAGRQERADARSFVLMTEAEDADAAVLERVDTVKAFQHTVLYVHQLREDALPPSGLPKWPEPGQVYLSPELVRQGEDDGVTSRYGTFAGTVGSEGLVSPSERLAYVGIAHVPDPDSATVLYAHGYGNGSTSGIEMLNQRPLWSPLGTLWASIGLPALALTVVAARVGSSTRDRRTALLHALGAGRWHRSLAAVAEAAVPTVLGTCAGAVPYVLASLWDVRLPPTGYILSHTDLQRGLAQAAAALALSLAVVVAVVVGTNRLQRTRTSTRPTADGSRVPWWRVVLCGVGVAIVVTSQYLDRRFATPMFMVGTVVMWAFLPSVAGALVRRAGTAIARAGYRRGRAGRIIGGRWTAAHPGVIVRLTASMVIGLGLIAQMQLWASRSSDGADAARASYARVGDTVIDVRADDMDAQDTKDLAQALPAGSRMLKATTSYVGPEAVQHTLLQAPCPTLKSLGLSCTSTPSPVRADRNAKLQELVRWHPNARVQAATLLSVTKPEESLIVVTPHRGLLPAVKEAAFTRMASAEPPGLAWVAGKEMRENANNWILLFGIPGLVVLAGAAGVSAASEFARIRKTLPAISVLAGTPHIFRSVARWHFTIPLIMCTAFSVAVTSWHSLFFITIVQEGHVSWMVLTLGAAVCAALSAGIGTQAARSAARAAGTWRPTAD